MIYKEIKQGGGESLQADIGGVILNKVVDKDFIEKVTNSLCKISRRGKGRPMDCLRGRGLRNPAVGIGLWWG